MKAFLFPHRLQAPVALYTAALHRDDAVARRALEAWLDKLEIDQIRYHQHKLVGLIVSRFSGVVEAHPQGSVLGNVARQGRLRAHAQVAILRDVLAARNVQGLGLVAIGALRERMLASARIAGDLDKLELALPLAGWDAGLDVLSAAGWRPRDRPRRARGRRALVAVMVHDKAPAGLNLLGLPIAPPQLLQLPGHAGLSVMTAATHRAFLQSRAFSLLVRRDQALFDIYCARVADWPGAIGPGDLPWPFRRKAALVLGAD